MKKTFIAIAAAVLACVTAFTFTACGSGSFDPDKQITVVARELASGTREAFDTVVTDGTNFLMQKENGEKKYYTTDKAVVLNKTGDVMTKVAADRQAIGYISLGSVNDTIKVIKVNGVEPSKTTVLNGTYKIQRPFVVMTNKTQTLTPVAADFMSYLRSASSEEHCNTAGTVYLSDPAKRGTADAPIAVESFTKQASLPSGGKIIVRGSTSMEKFIFAAAAGYAELYGADADSIFDIELQGSSVGTSAVEGDTHGNVIGLSSSAVSKENIISFNVCLDAVAVIVNNDNNAVSDLTLKDLYLIFTGKTAKFSELKK